MDGKHTYDNTNLKYIAAWQVLQVQYMSQLLSCSEKVNRIFSVMPLWPNSLLQTLLGND